MSLIRAAEHFLRHAPYGSAFLTTWCCMPIRKELWLVEGITGYIRWNSANALECMVCPNVDEIAKWNRVMHVLKLPLTLHLGRNAVAQIDTPWGVRTAGDVWWYPVATLLGPPSCE